MGCQGEGERAYPGSHTKRDRQRAPLPSHGEPEQPNPWRDLGEQYECPGSRPPKAQDDGGAEHEVDISHEQVAIDEGQQRDRQRGPDRTNQEDGSRDPKTGPDRIEDLPRQQPQWCQRLEEGGRVQVGAGQADLWARIGVVQRGSPVRPGIDTVNAALIWEEQRPADEER